MKTQAKKIWKSRAAFVKYLRKLNKGALMAMATKYYWGLDSTLTTKDWLVAAIMRRTRSLPKNFTIGLISGWDWYGKFAAPNGKVGNGEIGRAAGFDYDDETNVSSHLASPNP